MYPLILLIFTIMVLLVNCCDVTTGTENGDQKQKGWAIGGSDGNYGTILHTQDGGTTWIRQGNSIQLPDAGFSDICIIDENTLLVVGGLQPNGNYNVFKSDDGGDTWTLSGARALENLSYDGIFALDENNIWIVGEEGSIYYSTDAADSWTQIEVPEEFQEDYFLRIAAKSTDDIWVVGDKHVNDDYPIMLHTTDGGINWERLNPIEDLNIIHAQNGHFLGIKVFGNSVWAIGGDGQFVIRSADNGTTWENLTGDGTMGDANDIFLLSETEAYVVKDYGGIYSTNDAGIHWTEYYADTNNWLVGIAILNNINIWICGSPGGSGDYSVIKYSADAGTTWQEQTPQLLIDNDGISLYKIRFIETD
jgi:photosystem II stability/assembly factor-like uncharacterized protein